MRSNLKLYRQVLNLLARGLSQADIARLLFKDASWISRISVKSKNWQKKCRMFQQIPSKSIPGFRGLYSATSDGRIWSHYQLKFLRPGVRGQYKYSGVTLRKNGKSYTCYIHRLMWLTYRGRIPKGFEINHKNGRKQDNRLVNLECGTPKENMVHAWRTGLRTAEHSGKLKVRQVRQIKRRLANGAKPVVLARQYGVSDGAIYMIKNGHTWGNV